MVGSTRPPIASAGTAPLNRSCPSTVTSSARRPATDSTPGAAATAPPTRGPSPPPSSADSTKSACTSVASLYFTDSFTVAATAPSPVTSARPIISAEAVAAGVPGVALRVAGTQQAADAEQPARGRPQQAEQRACHDGADHRGTDEHDAGLVSGGG
jgi:hypothetical protein